MADRRHNSAPASPAVTSILERLRGAYGTPHLNCPRPPTDELIMTILSQHTSDINTERAFTSLKDRFPRWEDVAHACVDDVADAIKPGGLANVKSVTIQSVLKTIACRTGGYDLACLRDMSTDAAYAWLTSLHGVGPKTAACVLLFSLGRPVMPVDTHVHRVSLRLGLVAPKTSAEKSHGLLEAQVPSESMYDAHMLLIQHGRRTCKTRLPTCMACVVADICPSRNRAHTR